MQIYGNYQTPIKHFMDSAFEENPFKVYLKSLEH